MSPIFFAHNMSLGERNLELHIIAKKKDVIFMNGTKQPGETPTS